MNEYLKERIFFFFYKSLQHSTLPVEVSCANSNFKHNVIYVEHPYAFSENILQTDSKKSKQHEHVTLIKEETLLVYMKNDHSFLPD